MLDSKILRLVAITDDAEDHRPTLVDRVAAAVRGGATSVQVRLKTATPRAVVEITRAIMARVDVPVIVNDRADIALAAGAAGVRLVATPSFQMPKMPTMSELARYSAQTQRRTQAP